MARDKYYKDKMDITSGPTDTTPEKTTPEGSHPTSEGTFTPVESLIPSTSTTPEGSIISFDSAFCTSEGLCISDAGERERHLLKKQATKMLKKLFEKISSGQIFHNLEDNQKTLKNLRNLELLINYCAK
jgi:hypothetical protein